MRPLCRECQQRPVSRPRGVFCGVACAADAKARTQANLARANLAKAHAASRALFLRRAVQRVKGSELVALRSLLAGPWRNDQDAVRLILRIEQRGYRRGWCARDKRRAA